MVLTIELSICLTILLHWSSVKNNSKTDRRNMYSRVPLHTYIHTYCLRTYLQNKKVDILQVKKYWDISLCWAQLVRYRWLFLRKEQKSLPKLTSENLKSFISQTISVQLQWFRTFSVQKSEPHQSKAKITLWNWFYSEISRISNFRIWVWEVIFVPFLEKVTCKEGEGGSVVEYFFLPFAIVI